MALKDKLMTLEDFKAVRDVDVASNQAQFSAINESLGNVQAGLGALEPGLSDEAKEALLNCFDHVTFYGDTSVDYYSELELALFPDGRPTVLKLSDVVSSKGVNGWLQKKFLRLSAPPVNEYANAIMTYTTVNCSAGDKFIVNAIGAAGGRAWGFLNSNNEVISMANENVTVTNLELTAPANAVKLVIHNKDNGVNHGTCYKVKQEEISGFVVDESGNMKYSAVAQYSVIELDASITKIKFFENTDISEPGAKPWFIFRKVDSDTFYGTDGTNLYVFAWDASTGKYNATRDNSIATISATNFSSFVLPQNRELFIKNGVATLKNDNGGIISVSNANIISIWDQTADYTYENVRVKR